MKQSKKSRQRPGRFRRWVVRPVFWILAVLSIGVFALLRFLESDGFADRLRIQAEERLGAYLERPVRVQRLSLDLVPLTVEIEGFEIGGAGQGAPPFLSVERAVVEAELPALLRRQVELQHVYLVAPRVWVGFDQEGRADAPRFGRGQGGGAKATWLRFGSVEVEGGELVVDEDRMPLDFSVRDLEAAFAGVEEGIELRGRATTDDFGLRLPPGEDYGGRFEIHGLLRRHRLDVVRARLEGPDLTAQVSGIWRWHGDRELALDVEAEGDLAFLGRLGYLPDLVSGRFGFAGSLTRKPGIWLIDGDLRSPAARVLDRSLTALEGRLQADVNALQVDIERASYGAGEVSGQVQLGLAVDRGRVAIDLELDRVSLARLLSDQAIPIEGLGGAVSGPFEYQFSQGEPLRGDGWADLTVADQLSPDADDLPLSGTIPFMIGEGVMRSDAIRLSSADLLLTAAGAYDLRSESGAYDFELTTSRLERLVRLVPGESDEEMTGLWRPTTGRGKAEGRLVIDRRGAALRTRLDLEHVEAPGYRAEQARGILAVDGGGVRELRVELLRPDAAMIVAGALPFEDPSEGVDPPRFSLAVDAAGWPLEEAQVWLPFELPFTGRYTGVLELDGDPESPGGRLEGRLAPVRWGDLSAASLTLSGRFDEHEVRFDSTELAVSGGVVSARGTLGRENLGLEVEFDSTPLDLERSQITDRLGIDLAGHLTASGTIAGSLDEPDVEARLVWSDLAIGGEALSGEVREEQAAAGEAEIDLHWRGGRLEAGGSLLGLVEIAGGGALQPENVAVDLALTGGRLDRVVELLAPRPAPRIDGTFAGRLMVRGGYSPSAALSASLVLDELTVRPEVEGLADEAPVLTNLEPVVAELDEEGLRLRSLYLGDAAGASEVFVGGVVPAGGGLELNLQVSIASEWLGLLVNQVIPDARWSGGAFDAIATIEGDALEPRINGVGELREATLVAEALPTAIEALSATLLFYPEQVVVDRVTGRLAGGEVRAGGTISLALGQDAGSYSFQLVGERLSYRSPLGWTARGASELALASTEDGRQLTGSVRLDEALYVKDVSLGLEQLLAAAFGNQRLDVAPADEWLASTQLNLRIEADQALRMRNNLADLRGTAELVLRGSLARPVVFGTVQLEPGGSLDYAGASYEIVRGQLAFTNPYRIQPVVDLAARTELREYDISLNITGTPDRLVVDLASNPPLADLDVLALLTGSTETPVTGGESSSEAEMGAESFLYGQATSLLAQRFNRLFGLDKFRIDPLTSSTGELSSARVAVGKRLSRDLSVTYSYDPSETEEQVLEIEWSISRTLILVVTQNGDGSYAVDVRWEKAL